VEVKSVNASSKLTITRGDMKIACEMPSTSKNNSRDIIQRNTITKDGELKL
jgi:hypothetical protein